MQMSKILFFISSLYVTLTTAELSGLLNALEYFGLYSSKDSGLLTEELGQSRGHTHYNFKAYALKDYTCAPDDKYILHLLVERRQPVRKPPIMVRCLEHENFENKSYIPELILMKDTKDILNLMKPVGNATKRYEAGSCVIVHFCTISSYACATVAPMINMLPHMFPTLRFAYIDTQMFPIFNADFGIVALPALLLFHQGRPIVRLQSESAFATFITLHTGIKAKSLQDLHPYNKKIILSRPLPSEPVVQPDFYLASAWIFIFVCLANYVRKTRLWKQLVEMVQRNWRESEETQLEMID